MGQTPEEMGKRLMVAAGQVPALLFMVLSLTVEYAGEVLEEIQHRMVYTAGANRILDLPEYQDVGKAGALMRFLGEEDAALPVPEDNAPMQILSLIHIYSEGVCFAIIIMNCTVWLLDRYIKPVRFGFVKPEKSEKKEAAAK